MGQYKSSNMYPAKYAGGMPSPVVTPFLYDNPRSYVYDTLSKRNGGVQRGQVGFCYAAWVPTSTLEFDTNNPNDNTRYQYMQVQSCIAKGALDLKYVTQSDITRFCFFAMPIMCVFPAGDVTVNSEAYKQTQAKYTDYMYEWSKTKGITPYLYFIVSNTNQGMILNGTADDSYLQVLGSQTNISYSNSRINSSSIIRNKTEYNRQVKDLTKTIPSIGINGTNFISPTGNSKSLHFLNEICAQNLEAMEYKQYLEHETLYYKLFDTDDYIKTVTGIEQSETLQSVYFANVYDLVFTLAPQLPYSVWGGTANAFSLVASEIVTDIPVFTPDSIDQMDKYFKGEDYKQDNDEGRQSLAQIPARWDVYINGNNRPEITVTCQSDAWAAWRNSASNVAGLDNGDCLEVFSGYERAQGGIASEWLDDVIALDTLTYNNNFYTSYTELLELEYPNISEDANIQEDIWKHYQHYVRLSMRLSVPQFNLFSSVCECGIGIIGNPDLEAFSEMDNYGIVVGVSDGSQIYLHYNEEPPEGSGGGKNPTPPVPPPDPPTPPEIPPLDAVSSAVLTRLYKVTDVKLDDLGDFLWSASFWDNIKLINNNPIENIVSLIRAPINCNGEGSTIKIGNVDTTISADLIKSVPLQHIGTYNLQGMYHSFLDYPPYTNISVFLPFIGFYSLDTALYMGKTIDLYYAYDLVHGAVKALMYANGVYVQSFDGAGGIEVALTASNAAQRASQILQSALSLAPTVLEAAATKSPSAIANAANGAYEVSLNGIFAPYHSQRTGAYSAQCGEYETRTAYFVIDYPSAYYPANYAHNYGYPLNQCKTLGSVHGFTICGGNIDMTGYGCTETEKDMIQQMLQEGVYL